MKEDLRNGVAAIIVTYNPSIAQLSCLVNNLRNQVPSIFIIDNNSTNLLYSPPCESVVLVRLSENMGIAKAQNIGLSEAKLRGHEDFIFFDQDSIPAHDMVHHLLCTRTLASKQSFNVAAVGPVHIDQDSCSDSIFISTQQDKVEKIEPEVYRKEGKSFAVCDFLIASGCLFSVKALETIGYMEDELFIDCVDIEWGFRAKSKGWHCVASFEAKMHHKIGDAPLKIFGRSITTHSPLRHYYFYRNFYQLLKRAYIPSCWKWHTLVKSSIQAVIFSLFLSPRLEQFKYILKGILHGLTGKSGKYE